MMFSLDSLCPRLSDWRPPLLALLAALFCVACAQDDASSKSVVTHVVAHPQATSAPTLDNRQTATAVRPAATSRSAAQSLKKTSSPTDSHTGKRPKATAVLNPDNTTPSRPSARPKNRPKATAVPVPGNTAQQHPAPPAGAESVHSNLIGTRALEVIGKNNHLCALTFDDGPTRYTPQLLQLLRERGIKATFFLLGSQVRRRPDLVRFIVSEGHEVANHTYSHKKLSRLTPEQQQEEIGAVQELFQKLGVEGRFLRPPYGAFNKATLHAAAELDLDVILWSVDTNDWRQTLSIDGMSSRYGHDRPTRGVFLFHDTHLRTIEALPVLIDFLEQNQCRFVTLSEYVGKPPLSELRPQRAPIAAPDPGETIPHQFPADDGSDDNEPRPVKSSTGTPSPSAEVILPLQPGTPTAPAAVSLPASAVPDSTSVPNSQQPQTDRPQQTSIGKSSPASQRASDPSAAGKTGNIGTTVAPQTQPAASDASPSAATASGQASQPAKASSAATPQAKSLHNASSFSPSSQSTVQDTSKENASRSASQQSQQTNTSDEKENSFWKTLRFWS